MDRVTEKEMIGPFLGLCVLIIVGMTTVCASQQCPGGLQDRADVVNNPPGNDYDVYFSDDSTTSAHYFTQARANWVRDALRNSHDVYVGAPHNLNNPFYSVVPNDTCIYDCPNIGYANRSEIGLDAPDLRSQPEPYVRNIVAHELFHHVEYGYVNVNDWPSVGRWAVEGTARCMEDHIFLDNDRTPGNTLYVGEVDDYLDNPNRTLFEVNYGYGAALFWKYLCEQLGTAFAEPARGVDVIEDFWVNAQTWPRDSVRALGATINGFSAGVTFEDMFRRFCIANYTHRITVDNSVPNADRYFYFDETAAGGGTVYHAVSRTAVSSWNTDHTSSVVRWGARYFEIDVPQASECEVIGFKGQADPGARVSWALIAMKSGDVVNIYQGTGRSFYRSLCNDVTDPYDRLAAVVIGLDRGVSFKYAFGRGSVSPEIRYPLMTRMAFVGTRDEPERFQIRLLLPGPSVLTPFGSGTVSVRGLDASQLAVTLISAATGATYPVNIVNSLYVGSELWLVVAAPTVTAADRDLYDLQVCLCPGAGACYCQTTSNNSVLYADVTYNQVLVLDRSGSMKHPGSEPKIESARNACRLYVDGAPDDDRMGFVTFSGDKSECNNDATIDESLAPLSANRGALITDITKTSAGGWTSIGDGLREGVKVLSAAASPADIQSIVLLSDGMENEEDFWEHHNSACVRPPVKDMFHPTTGAASNIRVDTIAFGPDTREELLQDIAGATQGEYYDTFLDAPVTALSSLTLSAVSAVTLIENPSPAQLEVPNRLAEVYRTVQEDVYRQDRVFYAAVRMAAGDVASVTIPVTEKAGGGIQDAVLAINWNKSAATVDTHLYDPDGALVTASTADWDIFEDRKTNRTYLYTKVLPTGDWLIDIGADTDVQVICMLSGKLVRGVDIDINFSQIKAHNLQCDPDPISHYLRGLPVTILANLNDSLGGIPNVEAEAEIRNPRGTTNQLVLHDDGHHDDGLPGDGVYGNTYTRTPYFSNGGGSEVPGWPPTGDPGSYTVVVRAAGTSNYTEDFQRYTRGSFHVFEYVGQECHPDQDGDGMADRWEVLVGLDPVNPKDRYDDNDNDGLENIDEFRQGTLPLDPDTDRGGESDGSEVADGRDPLYERDDLMVPIMDYGVVSQRIDIPTHEPQANTNIVHYPISDMYRYMQIWRTDPTWTGFRMVARVDLLSESSGVHYDMPLINGYTYQYYLVAEGLSGAETAPTEIFTGTPKADPVPPKGWIRINNGASRADSLVVLVQLDTDEDIAWVTLSCDASFDGASWSPIAEERPFTLTTSQPDPALTKVYAKFRDAAGNESIVYHASIVLDRYGDFDKDGQSNELDSDDDNDGLDDTLEISATGILPVGFDSFSVDSDSDGLNDGLEDPDRDFLTNVYELDHGTDPGHNLADINDDDQVDILDVNLFRNYFMTDNPAADVNADGVIDDRDIEVFTNAHKNAQEFQSN